MSLLERTRMLHEEVEVIERAMYQELGDPATAKLKRVDAVARDQVDPSPRTRRPSVPAPPRPRRPLPL